MKRGVAVGRRDLHPRDSRCIFVAASNQTPMLIDLKDISLRTDEHYLWIGGSRLLPGCHASGTTEVEALANFQEAGKAHLEALKETGRPIPEPKGRPVFA